MVADPAMQIQAETLALSGIRHSFFTRHGGVSAGLYASLNGGVGSHDSADNVARKSRAHGGGARRRAALSAHRLSGPLAASGDRRRAMAARGTSARRRHRHPHPRPRDRHDHRRLRPDPARRSDGEGHRRRACRLARRAGRRGRGDGRGDGAARRRARPHPRRARADDPAKQLRSRPRSDRALCRRGSRQRAVFLPGVAQRPRVVRSAGYIAAGSTAPGSARSKISAFAPTPIRRVFSAFAARPTAPKPITAAT